MNLKSLARHYDQFTPEERLPLMTAASLRGDVAERERLSRSAPKSHYAIPDYHGLAEGWILLSLFHGLHLLDRAMSYLYFSALVADSEEALADDAERLERIRGWARLLAYQFTVEWDAWVRLCTESNMDCTASMEGLPGWEFLTEQEPKIRAVAFSPVEAIAFFHRACEARKKAAPACEVETRLKTVESELEEMRGFLKARQEWWN